MYGYEKQLLSFSCFRPWGYKNCWTPFYCAMQFSYLWMMCFVFVLFSHSPLTASHSGDRMWTTQQTGGGCWENCCWCTMSLHTCVTLCAFAVCIRWDKLWKKYVCVCFCYCVCVSNVYKCVFLSVNHNVCTVYGCPWLCLCRGYHKCYWLFCARILPLHKFQS